MVQQETWGVLWTAGVNLDEQRYCYRALNDWFKTAQGAQVGQAFAEPLMRLDASGEVRLQLGLCGENPWLLDALFKQTYITTPCLDAPGASLIASPEHLPLHQHHVDCVIAPLMVEMFGLHASPLDEIDRVLNPMGHVVMFGINPWSLWGLAARCHRILCFGKSDVHVRSPLAVERAWQARGYQLKMLETFYYVPPIQHAAWIRRCLFLNQMGKMMTLFPAGFYCLIMQKYTPCSPNALPRTRGMPLLLPG